MLACRCGLCPYSPSYADHRTADPISGEPTCTNGHHGSALSACFVMLTEAILITYYTYLTMELDTRYFCLNLKNKATKAKPSKIRSSIILGKIMEGR